MDFIQQIKGKNNLIIADMEYYPVLFRFKNLYSTENIKFISKNEVIDKLGVSFKKDPIPYLVSKKGIEFNKAKKYIKLLRFAEYKNNSTLNMLFTELEREDYITYDEYGLYELSKYNLFLFEMNEDIEIHHLLQKNNINAIDINFSDINCMPFFEENTNRILYFQDKLNQYVYIFSDILKKIKENEKCIANEKIDKAEAELLQIEKDSLKNHISILCDDDTDLFYIDFCSKLFNIPVFSIVNRALFSYPEVKSKIDSIYKNKKIEFDSNELKNEMVNNIKLLCDKYELYNLNFDFAYASLLEIISSQQIKETISDKGITISSSFNVDSSNMVYVTNFAHGAFYKVYDDKNVLSDEELENVFANPSYVLTQLDKRKKCNYLTYNNIAVLSRVKEHLQDKIYDSQFIEEKKLKKNIVMSSMNKDGLYTLDCNNLYHCVQADSAFYNKRIASIRSYDHKFKGLKKPVFTNLNKNWYVTNLETYIDCPFKYLLNQIMPLQAADYHNRLRGTLIHKVFENVNHADYDFENEFAIAKEEYKKEYIRLTNNYGPKEDAYISIIKDWLSKIIATVRGNMSICKLIENKKDYEMPIKFSLSDGDENYNFSGKIDKIIWTESNGKKYYTIIDYKSGIEKFNAKSVFLGKSVQLPIYYYGIESLPENLKCEYTNGGEFGGFAIQSVFFNTPKKACVENEATSQATLTKNIKAKGLSKNDFSYWKSIDISGIKIDDKKGESFNSRGGNFLYRANTFTTSHADESIIGNGYDKYNLEDLINDSKNALIDCIKKILDNQFQIAPTPVDICSNNKTQLVCQYCGYKNVCYHSIEDAVSYANLVAEKFPKKEVEPNEENSEITE